MERRQRSGFGRDPIQVDAGVHAESFANWLPLTMRLPGPLGAPIGSAPEQLGVTVTHDRPTAGSSDCIAQSLAAPPAFDREIDPVLPPSDMSESRAATRAWLQRWAPGVKHVGAECGIWAGAHQRIQSLQRAAHPRARPPVTDGRVGTGARVSGRVSFAAFLCSFRAMRGCSEAGRIRRGEAPARPPRACGEHAPPSPAPGPIRIRT